MATLLIAGNGSKRVRPKNGTDFQLDELQEFVEGFIEVVYIRGTNRIFIINERGKLEDKPINLIATTIAHYTHSIELIDCIVGNALLCHSSEVQ